MIGDLRFGIWDLGPPTVYLVRHGEVEHHRTDVSLTPRGRKQAEAAGAALAARIADGHAVFVYHSPVTRVQETADLIRASLKVAMTAAGRAGRIVLHPSQPDPTLCNVRFIVGPGREPEEPSLLYDEIKIPAYLQRLPPARAEFYRGFWASADPMGYWLTHDSHGGAESPDVVLNRLRGRLGEIFSDDGALTPAPSPLAKLRDGRGESAHWIMVTHSGTLRALLRDAFGADPGEPNFCEAITLKPSGWADWVTLSYRGPRTAYRLSSMMDAVKQWAIRDTR